MFARKKTHRTLCTQDMYVCVWQCIGMYVWNTIFSRDCVACKRSIPKHWNKFWCAFTAHPKNEILPSPTSTNNSLLTMRVRKRGHVSHMREHTHTLTVCGAPVLVRLQTSIWNLRLQRITSNDLLVIDEDNSRQTKSQTEQQQQGTLVASWVQELKSFPAFCKHSSESTLHCLPKWTNSFSSNSHLSYNSKIKS